jgi:stearoyl-CoA desaturase (delta-9 desaturase)
MSEPATSSATLPRPRHPAIAALLRWIDTSQVEVVVGEDDGIDWLRVAPFIGMHLACLAVLWVGESATALWIALASYALRMFAITAFYHHYFSHKTFHTSRAMQFLFGLLGASCVQRGPLWWAAHHRHHHRHADTERDVHSPRHLGFFRSHMGWFMAKGAFRTNEAAVPDLAKYPELRWLDRYDIVVPVFYAAGLYALGAWLGQSYPDLGTSGPQLLVWGFFVSTIVLFHVSVSIN